MANMMHIFKSHGFKRFITLLLIFVLLYLMRGMLNLMLLTFVFIYLINSVSKFLIRRFEGKINLNYKVMIVSVALFVTAMLFIIIIDFLPLVTGEFTQVVNQIRELYVTVPDNEIINLVKDKLDQIYAHIFSAEGITYIVQSISNISKLAINIMIALILSVFFLLEKDKISDFTYKFKQSKAAGIYSEFEFFGRKFLSSFGKVIEVQIVIATINGALSTIGLAIIGFPHLLGFGMMVMLLGLIPVAGVIISLVPLSIVAFSTGGIMRVVYVLILIALLHAFEAYILNPKLMSDKTKLPIFYTLSILIVSEHLAGVVGLIVGIPVFMFILDVIEVPYGNITKKENE
jgi:predicted PurR-regulated permease PerM